MQQRCYLVLDDETMYPGISFGAEAPPASWYQVGDVADKGAGEVVFNTGMTGYHEILTDPSYTGQIVTMTYPLIGNYGSERDWNESGPEDAGRPEIKAAGFVVRRLYTGRLPRGRESLHSFLERNGTPGISDVDTRDLTLRIRDGGSPNGMIVRPQDGDILAEDEMARCAAYLKSFPRMTGRNLIGNVGTATDTVLNPDGSPHFVLLDCGVKANIVRELVNRGCKVSLLPSSVGEDALSAVKCDALLFSNGPGDPAVLEGQVELIRSLIGSRPVFGICLGHQLISEALGAKTRKMKFGHHGVNQPVRDELTRRVFVTSQNHGFDVDEETLPGSVTVWFRNANDTTVEGIREDKRSILTAQFHPEAAPGPHDSSWIFDEFVRVASERAAEG